MNINEAGLKIIKDCEGFYANPYICPGGKITIGYGTTAYPSGEAVKLNDPAITIAEAEYYLIDELKTKTAALEKWLELNKRVLNANQFSALLSFAYNLGCDPITKSGRSMNEAILSLDPKRIRDAFMMYVKVTKKKFGISYKVTLPGLVTRRKLEADLFFKV